MRIVYTKKFLKCLDNQPIKIQEKFQQRVVLFIRDKFNPILANHRLGGEYKGYRSINITGDIRAIFQEKNEAVIFISVGSHSQLYG
jgi:addiction module RelE/StbE family toxin